MSGEYSGEELLQMDDEQVVSYDNINRLKIRPEELRLIGRYVSLSHNDKKWVGLVSLITKDTVVLINSLSMSIPHFNDVFSRKKDRAGQNGESPAPAPTHATRSPTTTTPQAGGTTPQAGGDETAPPPPAGAPAESTAVEVPAENADPFDLPAPPEVHNEVPKLKPFATFNRKDIAGVQFASDHLKLHRQFQQDPTVGHPPMELIRVYIRRYVVHTCQGNNPHKLTMGAFVSSRSKWKEPEPSLMAQVTKEEVPQLEAIEAAIVEKREKQQAQRRARAGQDGVGGGAGGAGGGGRGGVRGRGPPRDAEARELLMEIGVPARTTYCAIGHLALSITLLLYGASSLTSADVNIVMPFLAQLVPWIISAALSLLLCGLLSGFHGLNMNFPVRKPLTLCARTFWMIVATGLIFSAAIAVSVGHFDHVNAVTGLTAKEFFTATATSDASAFCSFASTMQCSGWEVPCSTDNKQSYCIQDCYNTLVAQSRGCQLTLEENISSVMLPLAIMCYLACITLILDWIFLQRFYHYGSLLAVAMGVTFRGDDPAPPAPAAAAPAAGGGGGQG